MTCPVVVLALCRRCGKHHDPREFVGGPTVGYCWKCFENHVQALDQIATGVFQGCQECLRSMADLDELSRLEGKADTRLVLEIKDGIYQVLCLDCDKAYQSKRRDLYARTPYGFKQNLW